MGRAKNWLGAAAGLAILAGALAAIDERVRYALTTFWAGQSPTGEIAAAGTDLSHLSSTIVLAVRDQSMEHAPLTLFAVGAMVLVLFMTKT